MKTQAFCSKCGADVLLDEPIRIDGFSMLGDSYPLCYMEQPIRLTLGESRLVWTIMKAFPVTVSESTLRERLGVEGDGNTISVLVHRVRRKLADLQLRSPIETIRGHGYRWKPEGGYEVAEKIVSGDAPVTTALQLLYGGANDGHMFAAPITDQMEMVRSGVGQPIGKIHIGWRGTKMVHAPIFAEDIQQGAAS